MTGGGPPRSFVIGIGAQKAGTSWLASYLGDHPEVFMPAIKEIHFWNGRNAKPGKGPEARLRRLLAKFEKGGERSEGRQRIRRDMLRERLAMGADVSSYMDFFGKWSKGLPVWCDITPAYAILDRGDFAQMAAVAGDVRFIFVMRNPADRYWSQLRFARRNVPNLDPFAQFRARLDHPAYRLRSDYRRTLAELFAAVDASRVHLAFFERLFTQVEVERLCDFLGVARCPADFTPVGQTASREVMSADMRALAVRHFAGVYRFAEGHFAGDIPESWRNDIVTYLA